MAMRSALKAPLYQKTLLFPQPNPQEGGMRGKDEQQLDAFSYVSPERRVPQDRSTPVPRSGTE